MLNPRPLHAVCVYATNDEHFKNEIAPYITALTHANLVTEPKYIPAHVVDKEELLKVDVIFLLLSMELINSRLKEIADHLKAANKLKRLQLIPVLLKPLPVLHNIFKNVATFPTQYEYIECNKWTSRFDAYRNCVNNIEPSLQGFKEYVNELEQCWEKTKAANTVIGFGAFIKKYPNSKFNQEAESKKRILEEENLWKQAMQSSSVKSYIHYLTRTFLGTYKFEANRHIYHLENNAALALHEITELEQLELAVHYKNKYAFTKNVNFQKIDELIDSKLKNYDEIGQLNMDKLNTVYLDALIYEKLEKDEIFACLTYQDLINVLRAKLHYFFSKIIIRRKIWAIFVSIITILLSIWSACIIYIQEFNTDWDSWEKCIFLLPLITIHAVPILRVVSWNHFICKDEHSMKEIEKFLTDFSILVKIYLIKRDQASVKDVVTTLHLFCKIVNFINVKTTRDYMMQLIDYTGMELQDQLYRLRLKKILPFPEQAAKIDSELES